MELKIKSQAYSIDKGIKTTIELSVIIVGTVSFRFDIIKTDMGNEIARDTVTETFIPFGAWMKWVGHSNVPGTIVFDNSKTTVYCDGYDLYLTKKDWRFVQAVLYAAAEPD